MEEFEHFRARWVLIWVLCNCSFGYGLNSLEKESSGDFIYMAVIAVIGIFLLILRTVFAIAYVI